MTKLQRILLALPIGALSVWLFTSIWYMTAPMAQNIENALEAGVEDTVSQASWLSLWAFLIGLVISLQIVWILDPTKLAKKLSGPHAFMIVSLPLATLSLTPLIGAFAGVFATLICIAGIFVRKVSVNNRKLNA